MVLQVWDRNTQGLQVEGPTISGNIGATGERDYSDVVQQVVEKYWGRLHAPGTIFTLYVGLGKF